MHLLDVGKSPDRSPDGGGSAARKVITVTIPVGLMAEARELGVNVPQAAESGIAAAVAERRQARWHSENQQALESSNAFVEAHGLPLARHRNF